MKKHYSVWSALVAACCFCTAAFAGSAQIITLSRPLLHTVVEIKAWEKNADGAIEEAFSEMERVNSLLNTYDPGSEVSRINRQAGGTRVQISPETAEALKRAVFFCGISAGALDITIGPLLKLWGFGKGDAGLAGGEPDKAAIRRAKALVDYRALELSAAIPSGEPAARLAKQGMWIDVGSFSKGFVADKAMAVLKKRGLQHALVIAGGTVCALGKKPDGTRWQVGIQHPRKKDGLLSVIPLQNSSISTSGDYENFYRRNGKRRTHIIDPRSGMPVPRMQSVSVIAADGMTSDALSTALFVLGPEQGIRLVESLKGAEAMIITAGGRISFSRGWPVKEISY
jgi:thiamine biosynthesis lipoprotein